MVEEIHLLQCSEIEENMVLCRFQKSSGWVDIIEEMSKAIGGPSHFMLSVCISVLYGRAISSVF